MHGSTQDRSTREPRRVPLPGEPSVGDILRVVAGAAGLGDGHRHSHPVHSSDCGPGKGFATFSAVDNAIGVTSITVHAFRRIYWPRRMM